jgi:hypothetical protein
VVPPNFFAATLSSSHLFFPKRKSACLIFLDFLPQMFKIAEKCLLVAGLLAEFVPSVIAVSFPATSGPYNTSIATTQLIDHDRLDSYAPTPRPRTLMISLFHPVHPAACCPYPTPYMDPISATFEDEQYAQDGVPAGTFSSLSLEACKSFPTSKSSCSVKGSNYPLILFSPGLGNTRLLYSAMAQQCVFHGFCSSFILSLR